MEYSIVGYGSLISHKSLKQTLKDKRFVPVIVKGYERIFNLSSDNGKDVLNLKISPKAKFNCVLFKVDEKELKEIKLREDEYNLEKTKVYDFKTGKFLGEALIVIDYIVDIDKKGHFPDKGYFILCREAAYHINKEFGQMWDETTFTADGKKVSSWIKNHKGYDTIPKG